MAAVLVLNATPGVDLLLTVSRTAQSGVRAGVMAALGINAGCALHALAAAFGLAALLAWSAAAFTLRQVGRRGLSGVAGHRHAAQRLAAAPLRPAAHGTAPAAARVCRRRPISAAAC